MQSSPSVTRGAGGLYLGQWPLVCVLGRPAPAPAIGWQTRRDTIFLPRSEYDERGATVRYVFRRLAPNGGVAHAAICTVPYTEGALRGVDRHFGVREGGGADQYRTRQRMVTIQGCVVDENVGCVMDPLLVTAPPKQEQEPCEETALGCTTKLPGGADDWWGDPNGPWSGGSTGTDSDDDEEEGVVAFGICIALKMGVSGWGALFTTGVSAYLAWDARQNTKAKYDAWARYRQDVDGGVVRYDIHINDLYYNAWKDAEHQEVLFYATTTTAAGVAGFEIFKAAVACSPYILAPV